MYGIPLDGVEPELLRQGLSFLFAQGTEILKRRRVAKDIEAKRRPPGPSELELPPLEAPNTVFVPGTEAPRAASLTVLDRLTDELVLARYDVEDYVSGEAPLDLKSTTTLAAVDRLRRVLAEIYGTDLTFQGERSQITTNSISVTDNRNYGVRADTGGTINAKKVTGSRGPMDR